MSYLKNKLTNVRKRVKSLKHDDEREMMHGYPKKDLKYYKILFD